MEGKSDHDPCSLSYKRQSALATPSVRSKKSFTVHIRKARMGFFRCFKKLLSIKKNRASFVMPCEMISNPIPRPKSESPRCSVNQLRSSVMTMDTPAVCVTRPSLRRRKSSYQVHSYGGSGSPPSRHRSSVRFSHPVVNDVARLSTASSALTADEKQVRGRSNTVTTNGSTSSVDLTTMNNTDGAKLLQPQQIWHFNNHSAPAISGVLESYEDFKNRLDGHVPRVHHNRVSMHAPSLKCLTRMPTMKLNEVIFQSSQDTAAEIISKHRSDALKTLEGSWLPKDTDRYVLASIPKEDLPITAVRIPSENYPASLIPGGSSLVMLPRTYMPNTAKQVSHVQHPTSLLPGGGKYKAYNAASQTNETAPAQEQISLPPTPNLTSEEFHTHHSNHYMRVESAVFDEVIPTQATKLRVSKEEFNKRHADHYKRVESGIFDEAILTSTAPASPIPFALQPANSTTSFLLSPTPTPTEERPRPFSIERKPISTTTSQLPPPKPLALAPALKTKHASKVPSPVPMNADRYPFVFKNSSTRFSAEPKYQPRFIDDVEAKHRAAEKVKADRKVKRESRSHRKMTEREAQVYAELQMLDARLKKLILS